MSIGGQIKKAVSTLADKDGFGLSDRYRYALTTAN